MPHDVNEILEQAKHAARLRIAERCKTDLYYLCRQILGYDDMTIATHGELCRYTTALLSNQDATYSVAIDDNTNATHSTDGSAVVQDILCDPTPQAGTPPAAPHSTQFEPRHAPTSDSNPTDESSPHTPPKKITDPISHANEDKSQFDPDKKMLHIEMPRGTFKSSVVTVGFAIQFHLNDPDAPVLIDSETYSKGRNFLAEIRGHLEDNEKLREVYFTLFGCYPDDGKRDTSVRWKDSELDLAARTKKKKEATFTASGIDKSINGMHYDLIICDDLHSEKNVTTKDQIDQVIGHWKLCLALLNPNKYMVVIGTRWDYADAYQYLLDYERNRFNVYIRKAHNSWDNSLLFPERLDEKFLSEQRRSMGSYLYSCQYENEPVDDETATFKRSYIKTKEWELVKDIPINWYLSVDPSWEGKDSDYAAFIVAGLDFQGNLYVRHVTRAKMTYGEIISEIFALYHKYRPKEIALETIASAKSLQYMLNEEQKRRSMWLPLREITSRQKAKEERIRGLAPYYEFGRAIHVREMPQYEELEYELLHFPKGKHDDMIDALATILEIAQPSKGTLTEEQREKKKRRIDAMTKPRSRMTGV